MNFLLFLLKPGSFAMRTWCSCTVSAPSRDLFISWLSFLQMGVCWHISRKAWSSTQLPTSSWRCVRMYLRAWPTSSHSSISTETWWETKIYCFWVEKKNNLAAFPHCVKITSSLSLQDNTATFNDYPWIKGTVLSAGCQELLSRCKWHSQSDWLWSIKVKPFLVSDAQTGHESKQKQWNPFSMSSDTF